MKKPGPQDWIWAPWRMTFIKSARKRADSDDCFFCDYVRARQDRKNLVVHRGRRCLVVMNLYPYTAGHLLVAPLKHKATLESLTSAERTEFLNLVVRSTGALRRVQRPHGFNVGINLGEAGGAGVPGHVHAHVVPRWSGDSNFMAVTGSTRVIPQSLKTLYGPLQKALKKANPKSKSRNPK